MGQIKIEAKQENAKKSQGDSKAMAGVLVSRSYMGWNWIVCTNVINVNTVETSGRHFLVVPGSIRIGDAKHFVR